MELTELRLYKSIPFQRDYKHTIDFDNISEQREYFNNIFKNDGSKLVSNFLYIDDNKKIIVEGPKGEFIKYNYLSYINGDNSKTYYAFIDKFQYVSEDSTEITFTIDLMQTYMFDYSLDTSLIDMAHVNRFDSYKKPMLNKYYFRTSENIECDEYESIYNSSFKNTRMPYDDIFFILISTSESLLGNINTKNANLYTYAIPFSKNNTHKLTIIDSKNIKYSVCTSLMQIGSFTFSPKIINVSFINDLPISYTYNINDSSGVEMKLNANYNVYVEEYGQDHIQYAFIDLNNINIDTSPVYGTFNLSNIYKTPVTNINGINYKSNEIKLQCYPYTKIFITNGLYQYDIEPQDCNDKLSFYIQPTISSNAKSLLIIDGYKNNYINENKYKYSCDYYTECELPYTVSSYQEYMINNSVKNMGSIFNSFNKINFRKGKIRNNINRGAKETGDVFIETLQAANAPDSAYNYNNNGSNYLQLFGNISQIYVYRCTIEDLILNLFTVRGYKLNAYEKINLKSRYWFNFIKTYECNITSNIGENDIIEKIKEIYNNGITFWHYNKGNYKFKDYTYNNIERSIASV